LFSNWLTYRAVAAALDEQLTGAVIREVFTQQKNELVIVCEREIGPEVLQFSAEPRFAWLLLKPEFARARKNSLDLFPDLIGDRVSHVRIARDDRIIRIALESGRLLFAFLFPVRANLIMTDGEGTVLESFKQHDPPADWMQLEYDNSIPHITEEALRRIIAEHADTDIRRVLRRLRPWLAGTLADELFHRTDTNPAEGGSDLDETGIERLVTTFTEMLAESARGGGHVYLRDHHPLHAAPIPLHHVDAEEHVEQPLLEALFLFLRRHFSGSEHERVRKRVHDRVGQELQRLRRAYGKLSPEKELKRQADEYEKFGNLLMIHLYDQPEQPGRMTVPDIFTDPRLVVTIPLKRRTTVLENAQRYFGKAQQTRASLIHVRERGKELSARINQLEDFHAATESAESLNELKSLFKEHESLMSELGLTSKGEKDESPFPFRRFVVTGGFEVWAGKNSANNDLLTVRHSRPNDIWFHTRGVGGSHVVLKVGSAAGDPSKEAIREAAAIAAYYSKHRNAKRVPVAYTEKKYVRKPKGAPPGTVTIDREKVVMVDPALPEG